MRWLFHRAEQATRRGGGLTPLVLVDPAVHQDCVAPRQFPLLIGSDVQQQVRLVVAGQEAVVRTARTLFPVVENAHDETTADLLAQRMQIHEKTAWMLRSLLDE